MHRSLWLALALAACKPDPVDTTDPLTVDDDGDGLTELQGDCDDADPAFSPNAIEIAGDGVDQDCDDQEQCFRDDDKDGYHRNSQRGSTDLDCDDPGESDGTGEIDCDDGRAEVYPGGSEVAGDEIDGNCDGQELCYVDGDDDDAGSTATMTSSDRDCDDDGEAHAAGDCDDEDPSVQGAGTEVPGDGVDGDCDGKELCHADADDDGARADTTVESADLDCTDDGEAAPTAAIDCADDDPARFPTATDVPGDAIDQDCDEALVCFEDADDDGSRSSDPLASTDLDCDDANEAFEAAPFDCDDDDPDRDDACRGITSCAHVAASVLAGHGVTAFDLAYADDCSVWLPLTSGSTDGVLHVTGTSPGTTYTAPTSAQDGSSIAIDRASGAVYVGANSPTALLTVGTSSTLVEVAAGSGTFANAAWPGITGEEPMSLAVLPNGDVLVPQFTAADSLSRVTPAGAVSSEGTFAGHVAAVGVDALGEAHVAVGDALLLVDDASEVHAFAADVVDFVFDYNDDLYVELANGDLVYVDHHGTTQVVEDTVTGLGKLAISPDGFLVRVAIDYPNPSTYEEWDISDR